MTKHQTNRSNYNIANHDNDRTSHLSFLKFRKILRKC